MERGNFARIKENAETSCYPDKSGIRARFLKKDIEKYDRIGLVAKVKEDIICLSFGTEVYWYYKEDLELV